MAVGDAGCRDLFLLLVIMEPDDTRLMLLKAPKSDSSVSFRKS